MLEPHQDRLRSLVEVKSGITLPESQTELRACGMTSTWALSPWPRHVFAGGGYARDRLLNSTTAVGHWTLKIIKRPDIAKAFGMIPSRWAVERTFAWLGRCRRPAKDSEASIGSAVAWVFIAHIRMLTRRRKALKLRLSF